MRKHIFCLYLLTVLLSACTNNNFDDGLQSSSDESAVLFSTEFPAWSPTSRAGSSIPEKITFVNGDVIHIQGEFEVKEYENFNPTGRISKLWRYDTFKYANGKWVPNSGNGETLLKWPWNATKGTFTAYYISGAKESLYDGTSYEGDLGGNCNVNDPLMAVAMDVTRDYAVNFSFKHLCTRLVIQNTKNNYAEEYWFYKKDISNAYELSYEPTVDSESGTQYHKLGFSFKSNPAKNEGAVSSVKVISNEAGTASNAGYVVYYLEPGKYYGSDLNYNNNRLYLTLNVDALDKPVESEPDGLMAGKTYILDIEKAKGIINKETTEDPWENPDPPVTDFDVQDLIDAISAGKDYKDILHVGNDNNVVLTKNVDFQNKEFISGNLPTNISLDGNYHYIVNAIHPLFVQCNGAIRNLEIRDTRITQYAKDNHSRAGALAQQNFGYIDNVRLRNLTIALPAMAGTTHITSIGGVVGEHENGQISNVYLIGRHVFEVFDPEAGSADGRVYLGGITGQANGSSPAIRNVFLLQDEQGKEPEISLDLKCNGGNFSVGGIAGMITTGMENCTVSATIDCSTAKSLDCCAGGLFGRGSSTNIGFEIRGCNVTGKVYGAFATTVVADGGTVLGRGIVGGIGGSIESSSMMISDCRSFCDVFDCFNSGKGYETSTITSEVFGSGAAFGRITANPKPVVNNCTAWGKIFATPISATSNFGGSFVGSFVGYAINGFELGTNTINKKQNGLLEVCGYDWMQ